MKPDIGMRPQLDIDKFCDWADRTFPLSTPRTIVAHFSREAVELQHAMDNGHDLENLGAVLSEIADCHLLLLHLCRRLGVNLSLVSETKFESLKQRQWGEPDHEGVVEHIREVTP